MKNIVICGYHGFANSGDEALLKAMIDTIRKKYSEVHITVLSNRPQSTRELYGVDSVYRYNFIKVNSLFKKADLFLFGGGSLLQDITSTRSLYYYLTVLKLAQKNKVKTMLYGNGIGPLCRKKSRKKVGECLNGVDLITLRDERSRKLLSEIGVWKPDIIVTADPAFSMEVDKISSPQELLSQAGMTGKKKYAVIAIRSWKTLDEDFTEKFAAFCDRLNQKYDITPLFVLMQYERDAFISKTVLSKMKTDGYIIDRSLDVDEMFSIISHAKLTIGMRLHVLIYSAILGVPIMALSYDPKDTEFMQSVNQPFCINVEELSVKVLAEMLESLMNNYEKYREELRISLAGLRDKAEQNAAFAVELMEK